MLSVPTVSEMANFKMKPETFYETAYAQQALAQAAFLLAIRTGLAADPEDTQEATLAKYAIMELANQIYLEAPYDEVLAKPFSSESIGSYSYSKSAQAAQRGESTGSMWFDLAVERLSGPGGDFEVHSDSISLFERSDYYRTAEGDRYVVGPADRYEEPDYYYINAERKQ